MDNFAFICVHTVVDMLWITLSFYTYPQPESYSQDIHQLSTGLQHGGSRRPPPLCSNMCLLYCLLAVLSTTLETVCVLVATVFVVIFKQYQI